MPLYEYRCEACAHQFEVIQKFSDEPIAVCPKCGSGPVAKLLSSPAFQFKGTGWYITDYARKGTADAKDGKEKPAKESKESKEGESKSTPAATSDSSTTTSSTPSKPTSTS
jgi:putative FmdB family regulatory protein